MGDDNILAKSQKLSILIYDSDVIGIIIMRAEGQRWGRAWILKLTYVYSCMVFIAGVWSFRAERRGCPFMLKLGCDIRVPGTMHTAVQQRALFPSTETVFGRLEVEIR